MREYKFRGKRIDSGEWVYGSYIKSVEPTETQNQIGYKNSYEMLHEIVEINGNRHYVIPETVGQYIDLKDKNNEEIYEDDVIKFFIREFESYEDTNGHIEEYTCKVDKELISRIYCGIDDISQFEKFKIIGNIYENTELLGKIL